MDIMSLIDSLKDPSVIQSMPIGDKMLAGLAVTFIGMTITFVGLLFLWAAIELLSVMLGAKGVKSKQASKVTSAPVVTAQQVAPVAIASNSDAIDEELIAVISAAVAASLKTSIHNIVVRNITRVHDDTPAWARSGRVEQMNSRF